MEGFTVKNGRGSSNDGGGIYARSYSQSDSAGDITIRNNIITGNNVVGAYGGGIYSSSYAQGTSPVTAGNISLINNIITGNQIKECLYHKGGGVFAQLFSGNSSVGEIVFLNNTVTANRSEGNGAGAYLFAGSGDESGDISVYNSIIRGNEGGYGADIFIECPDGNADFYFNDCHDRQGTCPNLSDNIDKDPCFVLPGYWDENGTPADKSDDIWITGNYHLKSDSPCIDAALLSRKKFIGSS